MCRMLILADDLSGASDCAVACVGSGLSAAVAVGEHRHDLDADVLAVDCDTRHLDPADAATQTVRLLERHQPPGEYLLYKKLDSTLRGNVAAEIAAVLHFRRGSGTGPETTVCVMAPAFPVGGRTTVGGHQLVHGAPLHSSETWLHHGSSSPTHIPSLLALAGLRPAHIDLKHIRMTGERTGEALGATMAALASWADVLVCDAETDDDLRAIAEASLSLGRSTVWAGSAGLARHLPPAAGLAGRSLPPPPALTAGPTLMVIGSMSGVAREQVAVLRREPSVAVVELPPAILLASQGTPQWSGYAGQLRAALRDCRDVVVTLQPDGALDRGSGRALSHALATMMEPLADDVGALVASGGETARALVERWGVTCLRMLGELEPGVPLAVAEGWRRPLPILTKAGAFGNPQTLVHCSRVLQAPDRQRASRPYLVEEAV